MYVADRSSALPIKRSLGCDDDVRHRLPRFYEMFLKFCHSESNCESKRKVLEKKFENYV